jgi:hypothetical protein
MWQLARPPQTYSSRAPVLESGDDGGGKGGTVGGSPRGMKGAGKERAKGQNGDEMNGTPHSIIAPEATGKAALDYVPGIRRSRGEDRRVA